MSANDRILAVDDHVANLQILEEILGESFTLKCVTSGLEAIRVAPAFRPNVVLLDLMMPVLDGNDTCRRLRAQPELCDTKILMLSAKADLEDRLRAYQLGAVDYIAKPFDDREVGAKVRAWSEVVHREQVDHVSRDLIKIQEGIGGTLTSLIGLRDTETGSHLCRMRAYAQILAEQLAASGPYHDRVDEPFLRNLYCASPLHDVGKIGISDAILLKPGPLTPGEFEEMQRHTVIGAELLARAASTMPSADYLEMACRVARHHHERFDGSGYPDGLVGAAIPLAARIVSVADVFDALTSDRVYRQAILPAEAAVEIVRGSGTQFDPAVVDAFSVSFELLMAARARFSDENHHQGE